ncbi:hypothetical protein JM93_00185 [Roseibium hamelinense]|uniref:DnaB helicase-like protein n=1 Tax=Roseibium hamelinense TaxID=150831 RepID=A0A562TGE7_9HYPH|nr:hypothetical protein [Roseibium hamelinense]MTI46166.1 hypothetical protein [Roseibium hamelinense]TWI92642.1 hypothetical protein JM93_00185 [Roseibium hamelinense]
MMHSPPNSFAVIDYMQLLDHQRQNPPLVEQLDILHRYCQKSGQTMILISQIDRAFEASGKSLPDIHDVRLPNSTDLSQISATCFLHEGQHRITRANNM